MNASEQSRFDNLYQRHLRMLKLQGKSDKTIDVYVRAVRRVTSHFDCCPDQLTPEQLEAYFGQLVDSHSWSTVKVDRNGLQFFWRHVLKLGWQWVNIIKPPKTSTIPDILTLSEVERLIEAARKLRYRVFFLTTYSMGLRLEETLSLQLMLNEDGAMSAEVRGTKIGWFRYLLLPTKPCGRCGASIATLTFCFPVPGAHLKWCTRRQPTWRGTAPLIV